jgi:hypothetical protein
MSNLKISQLTEFTGDTTGSYIVMNSGDETTTYKVLRETFIGSLGTSGSSGTSGTDGSSGSSGVDGYTPQLGIDYFNGQDGQNGMDGYTPQFGVDYFNGTDGLPGMDGLPGVDGYTPVFGIDYFNGTDGTSGTSGSDGTSGTSGISYIVDNVFSLPSVDPLPTGNVGDLAVSGSLLFFNNGTEWKKVMLGPIIDPTATPTPEPTATPTSTPTVEPTSTPTSTPLPATSTPTAEPTATPTSTPTPSPTPIPRIQIINNSTTRSVTSLQLNGSPITLDGGSYPVLNSFAYKMDGITVTAVDGSSTLMLNFGGTGQFSTFKIYKNDTLTFDLVNYAASSMSMGGMTLTPSDYWRVELA